MPSFQSLTAELEALLVERHYDAARINRLTEVAEALRAHPLGERLALAERLRRTNAGGDTIRLLSLLFQLTGDLQHYERLLAFLSFGAAQVDPKVLHYVYWCMQRQLFAGRAAGSKTAAFGVCDVFRFYKDLVVSVRSRFDVFPANHLPRTGPVRRVALVTNQFTGDRHQPTRDVFDYAWRLQDEQGVDVLIVNANLMALQVECLFIPPSIAEVADGQDGLRVVEMWGRRVPIVSVTDRAFSASKIAAVVAAIERFDPDALVAFGGSNLGADLFAGVRPVVCLPTTSGLTIGLGDLLLGYDGRDWTADVEALYRPPFARRYRPFTLGFAVPPTDPAAAGDFGLSGSEPVFVAVGTRIDIEADADFIALSDDVLDACPHAVLVFAGEAAELPERLRRARNRDRMRCLGHVADIRALYARVGVFLNPPRQGGGGSAAFALGAGVPVVTFPHGDVAGVAGPAFQVGDRAAYVARAARLGGDEAFRAEQAALARARYAEIGDRRAFAARLLGYCEEACELHRRRLASK